MRYTLRQKQSISEIYKSAQKAERKLSPYFDLTVGGRSHSDLPARVAGELIKSELPRSAGYISGRIWRRSLDLKSVRPRKHKVASDLFEEVRGDDAERLVPTGDIGSSRAVAADVAMMDPLEVLVRREDHSRSRSRLSVALRGMRTNRRSFRVFRLLHIKNLCGKFTARAFRLPLNTVKSHNRRAKALGLSALAHQAQGVGR